MKSSILLIFAAVLIFSNCGSRAKKSTPPSTDDGSVSTTTTGTLTEGTTSITLPADVIVVISGAYNPATSCSIDDIYTTIAIDLETDPATIENFLMLVKGENAQGDALQLYYEYEDVTVSGTYTITFQLLCEYANNIELAILSNGVPITPGDDTDPYVGPGGPRLRDPINLSATATSTTIELTWEPPTDSIEPTGYKIAYTTKPNEIQPRCDFGTQVTVGTVLTETLTGLSANKKYLVLICSTADSLISKGSYIEITTPLSGSTLSISAFSATQHPSADGSVRLTMAYTGTQGSYSIMLRRALGDGAIADINAGTLVSSTLTDGDTTVDDAIVPGLFYNYRLFVLDGSNNVIDSATLAQSVRSRGHKIFTSKNSSIGANFGGLAGGDALCDGFAAASSVINGGRWKAILSDSTEDASVRITGAGGIYNMFGDNVAANVAALWNTATVSLLDTLEFDEDGNAKSASVFTGSNSNGTVNVGTHCLNWSDNTMFENARFGQSSAVDSDFISFGASTQCNSPAGLYCISQ